MVIFTDLKIWNWSIRAWGIWFLIWYYFWICDCEVRFLFFTSLGALKLQLCLRPTLFCCFRFLKFAPLGGGGRNSQLDQCDMPFFLIVFFFSYLNMNLITHYKKEENNRNWSWRNLLFFSQKYFERYNEYVLLIMNLIVQLKFIIFIRVSDMSQILDIYPGRKI